MERLQNILAHAGVASRRGAAELIESGDFERHINRVRRAKRRALAAGEI